MKKLLIAASLFILAGCGGAGSALTGPESTERGEAHAINPARNVTVICENTKNTQASTVVNITNNCTKQNVEGVPAEESEG